MNNKYSNILLVVAIITFLIGLATIIVGWFKQDTINFTASSALGLVWWLVGGLFAALSHWVYCANQSREEAEQVIIPEEVVEDVADEIVEDHVDGAQYKVFSDIYAGGKKR